MRWLLAAAIVLLSATGGKQTETQRDVISVGGAAASHPPGAAADAPAAPAATAAPAVAFAIATAAASTATEADDDVANTHDDALNPQLIELDAFP